MESMLYKDETVPEMVRNGLTCANREGNESKWDESKPVPISSWRGSDWLQLVWTAKHLWLVVTGLNQFEQLLKI